MSQKGRASLKLIFESDTYKAWAKVPANAPEVNKVERAWTGQPHMKPSSRFAQGLVGLCEENPPLPPVPPSSVPAPFSGKGMTLLEPTGGVEDITRLKASGFTYVLLNLAYVSGGNWDTVRQRCAAQGIQVVPWRRVHGPADSQQIETTAQAWGCTATAHNLELEAATTYPPANLASYVKQNFPARSRAVITEPWAQNGAGWGALKEWVGMPEAFLNADPRWDPKVCCDHLKAEGIPNCVPLFGWGAWSDAPIYIPPAQYLSLWSGAYGVYFGDSREPQYQEWK